MFFIAWTETPLMARLRSQRALRRLSLSSFVVSVSLILAACGATPTPTAPQATTLTPTTAPTATLAPTNAPMLIPTATAAPTTSATPTKAPMPWNAAPRVLVARNLRVGPIFSFILFLSFVFCWFCRGVETPRPGV